MDPYDAIVQYMIPCAVIDLRANSHSHTSVHHAPGWTRESIRLHPRCNIRRSSLYPDHHLPHIRQIPVDMKSRRVIHVRPGVVAVVAVIDLDVVNAPFAERFGKQSSIFKNSYQAAGKAMLTISSAVFRVKSSSIPHSYIFHMLKPTEASWRGRLCRQE